MDDIVGRWRGNWRGYIREYRFWLVLTVIACLADMGTTIYFMLRVGCDAEAHPVIRLVATVLGPILGPIVGKLCQFAAVIVATVFLRRQAFYIFAAVILLYLWAARHNLLVG